MAKLKQFLTHQFQTCSFSYWNPWSKLDLEPGDITSSHGLYLVNYDYKEKSMWLTKDSGRSCLQSCEHLENKYLLPKYTSHVCVKKEPEMDWLK